MKEIVAPQKQNLNDNIQLSGEFPHSNQKAYNDSFLNNQPDFGILFDVDGVIARGSNPLSAAAQAVKLLTDARGHLRVPIAFVTNACNRSYDKAAQIQRWLGIEVTPEMVIHAPTALKVLSEYHNKHVLIVGQEYSREIAEDLGFTNISLLDDVTDAYPLLDMVDHENRKRVAQGYVEKEFPQIEAIVLLGEPIKWESNLQILIDLLLTGGLPVKAPDNMREIQQLPVIACNMDLQFMAEACMPRYGHGAFLVCLEALYKKITGKDLQYTALVGKPCEITYRYAEHVLNKVKRNIGIDKPLRNLYFVGDNPQVDITGANMYNEYLRKVWNNKRNSSQSEPVTLPSSRKIPETSNMTEQTARAMFSLLVGTGVYKPNSQATTDNAVYHGHRDIEQNTSYAKPTQFLPDVYHAVQFVMEKEQFNNVY